ncbi:MAG: polynucleotide adenylyltransferase PcnB [Pseudomonadota bacterium]|nr:polynucleotide adenylyltransferase PcnB [Pseudomonadota bacterium]
MKKSACEDAFRPRTISPDQHRLSPAQVSRSALQVVRTLQAADFSAEVVGGCVRDLLLGHAPKDFDVVTDAEPEEIRRLFRRARLIGRRFRLAHVRVGREIVEVSTYRATPDLSEDVTGIDNGNGQILRDNVFGNRDSDAQRRDFSINALYYDPVANALVDYAGGFEDLGAGVLQTIGDPIVRFREDPVRMLRAIRFVSRLSLRLEAATESALGSSAGLLSGVAPPRLFDESLKLFQNGHAESSFRLLREFAMLPELLADASHYDEMLDLNNQKGFVWLALRSTDKRVKTLKVVNPAFLYAVLLWRPLRFEAARLANASQAPLQPLQQAAALVFARLNERITVPRRMTSAMLDIWELQRRLELRRKRTLTRLTNHRWFRAAYDFLLLRAAAGEVDQTLADWWTELQAATPSRRHRMIVSLGQSRGRRRRKGCRRQATL